MRSFADYRKGQLRNEVRRTCLREGVEKQFEILRLDLLETIKLPNNVQGTILAEAQYTHIKKQDYDQNRYLVEEILRACKEDFYKELLSEAQAKIDAGTSLQQLRDELIAKIKTFIQELRSAIGVATGTTRDLSQGDAGGDTDTGAVSPGAPAGRPGAGPSPAPRPSAPSASPNVFSPGAPSVAPSGDPSANANTAGVAGAPTGRNDYPRWSDYRGETRPSQGGGHQPAPYGSMVPSDGIRGGLSRLWRRITRPIRRIWHGDAAREMQKEHLESMFVENWDQVKAALDRFEADIIPYINQRIDQIVRDILPAGAAAAAGGAKGKLAVGTQEANPVGDGSPAGQAQAQAAAQGSAAEDLALSRGAPPEQAAAEKQQAEQFALEELAKDGAAKLEITLNLTKRPRKGDYARITEDSFVDNRTGKPFGLKKAALYHAIVQRAYEHMFERAADKYPEEAFTAKGGLRQGSKDMRIKAVEAALGIKVATKKGGFMESILNLLAAVEKHYSGRVAAPPAEPTVKAPGAKVAPVVAPGTPGAPAAKGKTGQLPMGTPDAAGLRQSGAISVDQLKAEVQKQHPALFDLASGYEDDIWVKAIEHSGNDLSKAVTNVSKIVLHLDPEGAKAKGWDGSALAAAPPEVAPGSPSVKAPVEAGAPDAAAAAPNFEALANMKQQIDGAIATLAAGLGESEEEVRAAAAQVDIDALMKAKGLDPATMTEADVDKFIKTVWFPAVLRKVKSFADEEESPAETGGASPEAIEADAKKKSDAVEPIAADASADDVLSQLDKQAGAAAPAASPTAAPAESPRKKVLKRLAAGEGSKTRQQLAQQQLAKEGEPVAAPAVEPEPEPVEDTRPFKSLPPAEQQAMLAPVNVTPEEAAQIGDDWSVDDVKTWLEVLPKRREGTSEIVPTDDAQIGLPDDQESPDEEEPEVEAPEETPEAGAADYLDDEGNVVDEEGAFAALKKFPAVYKAAVDLADAIAARQETGGDFDISQLGYNSMGDVYHTANMFASQSGPKEAARFLKDLTREVKMSGRDEDERPDMGQSISHDEDNPDWEEIDSERDDNRMRRESFSQKLDRIRKKLLLS